MSSKKDSETSKPASGFSRRGFLQGVGISSGAVGAGLLETPAEAQVRPANVVAGETSITLQINGKPHKTVVEPRMTLLDAMRDNLDLTAAKRVCDRGTCGACTVMVDKKAIYSCTMLAIDAQGKQIQTLEGVAQGNNPHPIVQAFVNNDAQQCGYCTPGFVMASKAFLDRNPKPNMDEVKAGLGGNFCRCGTYVGIRQAVLEASKQLPGGRNG